MTGDKYDWDRTYFEITMEKAASDDMFDYWECGVRPKYKRLSYGFRIHAGDETVYMVDSGIGWDYPYPPAGYFEFPYIHEVDVFKVPEWAKAVFYQIMTERFANGNPAINPEETEVWGGKPEVDNFFGGDLQGVLDHLDDLVDLGINAIYFTPLFLSLNHKYDTVDYKQVDPHFGDNELLKSSRFLPRKRHSSDSRCGIQSLRGVPPFQDVLKHGEKSDMPNGFM